MARTIRVPVAAAVVLTVVTAFVLLSPTLVSAWAGPSLNAYGGGCNGTVHVPITWTIANHETAYPESPLYLVNVSTVPNIGVPEFLGLPLANTAGATATATSIVSPVFHGKITLHATPKFDGPDGTHTLPPIAVTLTIPVCATPVSEPPATTTTTSTTTTTAPVATTTSTTVPIPPTTVAVQAVALAAPAEPVAATPGFTG